MRLIFSAILAAALAAAQQPQPAKELRIVKPALRQYEDGPPMPPNTTFGPGETVFVSFQIQGFKASDDSLVDLHWTIDALDPDGVKITETSAKDIKTKLSAEDKNWMPLARDTFMLPPIALPGNYKVAIAVQDRLAGREAKTDISIPVRGHKVEPSATLVSRNFRFQRGDDDSTPMTSAVYRPGDAIWARFDIVGYKFGERNRIHVEYGVAVVNPEGKTMFSQPQAAVEERDSFYPQKYVPGSISLTTQKNTRPGDYTIVLTLRDGVGNQTVEEKHTFKLE